MRTPDRNLWETARASRGARPTGAIAPGSRAKRTRRALDSEARGAARGPWLRSCAPPSSGTSLARPCARRTSTKTSRSASVRPRTPPARRRHACRRAPGRSRALAWPRPPWHARVCSCACSLTRAARVRRTVQCLGARLQPGRCQLQVRLPAVARRRRALRGVAPQQDGPPAPASAALHRPQRHSHGPALQPVC